MQFVNPEFALFSEKRRSLPPFTCLRDNYEIYRDFDYNSLNSEWEDLLHCFGVVEKEFYKNVEVVKFWAKVFEMKTVGETLLFRL